MEPINRCPQHAKATLCPHCSVCKNCPGATDDCVLEHRQHRDGPKVFKKLKAEAHKRLAEARKKAKAEEEAQGGLSKRIRPADLSEGALESVEVRAVHEKLELEDARRVGVAPRKKVS